MPQSDPKHVLALAVLCWADMRTDPEIFPSPPNKDTSHGCELLHLLTNSDHDLCLSGLRAAAFLAALVRNRDTAMGTDPDGFICFGRYTKLNLTSHLLSQQVIAILIKHSRSTNQPDIASTPFASSPSSHAYA
jgi:hypothetical protein